MKQYKFYVYPGNNGNLIKKCLLERGNWEEIDKDEEEQKKFNEASFIWRSINFTVRKHTIIEEIIKKNSNLNKKLLINHFENTRGITTKTGIVRSLKQYYKQNEHSVSNNYGCFDSIATTYILTAGQDNIEYVNFMQRFNQLQRGFYHKETVPQKHCQDNMWLLKPANDNQGKGIEIFKNFRDINIFLNTRQINSMWVAQKYIEKPLLFKKRKFDIRVWTTVSPKGEVFFYKHSYVRTSSSKYDTQAKDNYVHLTNNCLQQKGADYGAHEDGNTLPISELFDYIRELYPDSQVDIETEIVNRMKDLVIDTFLSVKHQMIYQKRDHCFELFGYDFLIDEDLRTWIIEVNLNPYIGVPNPYIGELLPKMINNLFQLMIDPVFPPQNEQEKENGFELIYSELPSVHNNNQPKNCRQPFNTSLYPLKELEQLPNRINPKSVNTNIFDKSINVFQKSPKKQNPIQEIKDVYNQKTPQQRQPKKFSLDNKTLETKSHKERNKSESQIKIKSNSQRRQRNLSLKEDSQNQNQTQNDNNLSQIFEETLDDKKSSSNSKISNSKDIYYQLKKLLNNNFNNEFDPFYKHLNTCLMQLMNWELLEDSDIDWSIKTLELVLNSRMSGLFTDKRIMDILIKILQSQNFLLKIQLVALQAVKQICKNVSLKLVFLEKNIAEILAKIALSSIDPQQRDKYDLQLRLQAIQCIIILGGIYDRKIFIPGETRKNDESRKSMIENGGLITLIQIQDKCEEKEILEVVDQFFSNLDLQDYEYQQTILNEYKQSIGLQQKNEEKLNDNDTKTTEEKQIVQENNSKEQQDKIKKSKKIHKVSLLQMVDIDRCEQILGEILKKKTENIKIWEKKEQIKKQVEILEQQRAEELRLRQIKEKKMKLEQIKKKRDDENKKRIEMEKKRLIVQKENMLRDQEHKQRKFEDLLKKKEEQVRQQKQLDQIKLQQEQKERSKMLDEFQKQKISIKKNQSLIQQNQKNQNKNKMQQSLIVDKYQSNTVYNTNTNIDITINNNKNNQILQQQTSRSQENFDIDKSKNSENQITNNIHTEEIKDQIDILQEKIQLNPQNAEESQKNKKNDKIKYLQTTKQNKDMIQTQKQYSTQQFENQSKSFSNNNKQDLDVYLESNYQKYKQSKKNNQKSMYTRQSNEQGLDQSKIGNFNINNRYENQYNNIKGMINAYAPTTNQKQSQIKMQQIAKIYIENR